MFLCLRIDVKMRERKLFCEISPITYKISVLKCCTLRRIKDFFSHEKFACTKSDELLPNVIMKHQSLIRRTLGEVDPILQDNKAVNLAISAPKVSGVIIKPGETFSFWRLVGKCRAKDGYREGLTISKGVTSKGVGGGMCQFTNLIHWMVLHTPLTITEHHHHDRFDLFPDFGRRVPFGTGTSITYNYLDYRFKNTTDMDWQLIVYTDDMYLYGELRSSDKLMVKYHIRSQDEHFVMQNGEVFRVGKVVRSCVDAKTGDVVSSDVIRVNHAKVMYDTSELVIVGTDKI